MDTYLNQTSNISINNKENDISYMPANGLVYNHLQLTLQVQTDLKNQQRVQSLLNSANISNDSMLGFDELYSSVTSESDISYLQLMEQAAPFYTPIDPLPNNAPFGTVPSSMTDLGSCTNDFQQLCHPLSLFPENDNNELTFDVFPCDYHSYEQNILEDFEQAFNPESCFSDLSAYSHMPSFMPSGSFSTNPRMAFRSNSTPMLSASFSFSSFSTASSAEDEEDDNIPMLKEENVFDKPTSCAHQSSLPKKSASISCLADNRTTKRKKKMSVPYGKSNAKQQKKSSISSSSSESLSYYLAKQRLSDVDDCEEEYQDSPAKISRSASAGNVGKKGRNVDKACNHCKRSHLRCDNVRPCRRCVTTGKIGCQDVKHKPRGRPRLQKRL